MRKQTVRVFLAHRITLPCDCSIGILQNMPPSGNPCLRQGLARTSPEVMGMTAGPEAMGLSHGCGFGEAARKRSRVVGVAPERDRRPAFFAPPADGLRAEPPAGVDLQCPVTVSKRSQGVTELILERVRIERSGPGRPVADRVVDVGENGEHIGACDQAGDLGQVRPDDLGRWPLAVQVRPFEEPLAGRQEVQGTEYAAELPGVEQFRGDVTVLMWFAEFHSGDDAKVRKLVAAPCTHSRYPFRSSPGGLSVPPGVTNAWRCSC